MDLNITGKKALITGGSRGIGFAVASTFVNEGGNLSTCARNNEDLQTALQTLNHQRESAAIGESVDVADSNALQGWIENSADELGGVDILILNTSAMATRDSSEDWQLSFDVDMMAAVNAVKFSLPYLKKSSSAAIVFVSSIAALESAVDVMGSTEVGPYGVFKAAITNYAASLSTTFAPLGIRVNTVSPGPIEFEDGVWDKIRQSNSNLYAKMRARCRLGRLGNPGDVADAVVFLASPAASFITGTNLVVDGGATRRVQY